MSYSANRFTSMNIKSCGVAAYMGILPSLLAKRADADAKAREMDNLFTELDEMLFNAFYKSRFASTCISERSLVRQDCLNASLVQVYTSRRAYRKAMASTGQTH